jgi:ectonucleotide pyrophosphatase/phosphodiesterase family protein 5
VDQVLGWLKQPEAQRPTFLTLYFSDIDDAGHRFGPDAAETRAAAQLVDRGLARLVDGVRALQLESRVNYVLVSDHGMAAISPSRSILLDDYIDSSKIEVIDSSPVVTVNPVGITTAEVFAALKDKHPNLKVFSRDTLPEEYRLRGHPRLAAVIGIADEGWHVLTKSMLSRWTTDPFGGNHGYDPRNRSMHGLFVASGPLFKAGLVVPSFENVHVYELICRVLGLRPGSNDGDARVTAGFLR